MAPERNGIEIGIDANVCLCRGMQTVWVMGNETEVLGKVPRPEVEGYLTYGGDVYGNESHYPRVVHHFSDWAEDQ